MAQPKYPAIPDPTIAPTSLRDSILAIKQALEILTEQRGDPANRALMPEDLEGLTNSTSAIEADVATNTATIAAHEAAWTSYTPTVTAGSGTVVATTTGKYQTIGKTVFVNISIVINTNVGASVSLIATLPAAAASGGVWVLAGQNTANTALVGLIAAGASTVVIHTATGGYPAVGTQPLYVSGVYEAA